MRTMLDILVLDLLMDAAWAVEEDLYAMSGV